MVTKKNIKDSLTNVNKSLSTKKDQLKILQTDMFLLQEARITLIQLLKQKEEENGS